MSGKIENGQLVTVTPLAQHVLKIGDIVLCKVNGVQYLHLVKAISGGRVQIGNNKGRINGWDISAEYLWSSNGHFVLNFSRKPFLTGQWTSYWDGEVRERRR